MVDNKKTFNISLTVDVEDYTFGVDRHRFIEALTPLLESMRNDAVKATFFVNGEVINDWRGQIIELASEGHEIGLHGFTHRYLENIGKREFREELKRGFSMLASILESSPAGFRAPYFSLNTRTPWAPDLILESGFIYSSSVLPCRNVQSGFPGAPRHPFLWENGLVEFPAPVYGIGDWRLPMFGGGYLRVMPKALVNLSAHRARRYRGSWTYCHPYDFDVDEPKRSRQEQSWLLSKLLAANRELMLPRIVELVDKDSELLENLARDHEFVGELQRFAMR